MAACFSEEDSLYREGFRTICGVDEVGRGALAGPVVAAAVVLAGPFAQWKAAPFEPFWWADLDDSKKKTPLQRRKLADLIVRHGLVGLGAASAAEIDRLNILQASLLAMRRAVAALGQRPAAALVDGTAAPDLAGLRAVCLVKGDGRSYSIAAASIVAKVFRDRLMARLGLRYPSYGWEANAGYGTAAHRQRIRAGGPSPHHRFSFAPLAAGGEKKPFF